MRECVYIILFCQERNFNIVLDVLTRFRAADVEKAVKSLSSEQVDMLMKYIYRGFASPTENSCGILLSWHDKVSWPNYCVSAAIHHYSGCGNWRPGLHCTSAH